MESSKVKRNVNRPNSTPSAISIALAPIKPFPMVTNSILSLSSYSKTSLSLLPFIIVLNVF